MSKEQKKTLYSGTLVALTQEIEEFNGVVALRLHKTGRSYPMVLFKDACYTQFGPKCVGKKIVWAREVTKAELRAEYPEAWLVYQNSRAMAEDFSPHLAKKLTKAMDEYRLLVLHHMNDGSEYLVQAKSVEVLKKPPELKDAWEYTVVPEVEQDE